MEVVSSLAGTVMDTLFGVAKKEISHIWNSSENVTNLVKEEEKLSGMKGRVQQQIDLAKSKGELLLVGVEEWMLKADAEISEATKFINNEAEAKKTCCRFRFCVNLGTLYHYGKMAAKKTSLLLQHQECGKGFETCVSVPAPTPTFIDLYQSKNLEDIHTQKMILEEIIRAIEDDKIQIVGINGLGGVGKTTLASEVAAKMKNQFDYTEFITVSQTIDSKLIQDKVKVAATRIINGEKVLIILDDVWEEVNLVESGIPCGSGRMNCKILLTSRSREVCEAMNAQKNISVNPLPEEEAWSLFERVVGKSEWDDSLKEVALKIVQECGGLPLFIQAVGKALRNKEIKSWEVALGRLQDPTDEDVPFKRKGIMQLKLSYDYMESEVAKSCFLLCSMFPEDSNIYVEDLTYYGLGLGLFNNSDSIQGAKARVQLAVDYLKSCFLLSPVMHNDKDLEDVFKMHDLVRDMALFITSKGNDKFLVLSGKNMELWQPRMDVIKRYNKISIMRNKICKFPEYELDLPLLDTFIIQENLLSVVPDEFFQGMKKLKVLDMSYNDISSLPLSLKRLTKLCMLDLSGNDSLCEISILGELTCLEILNLRYSGIRYIPEEFGRLTKLRILDVSNCNDLSYVAPGVISKLIWLEEFHADMMMEEGDCKFIVELCTLKLLDVVVLSLSTLHNIPNNAYFKNLKEFHIQVNASLNSRCRYNVKRIVEVSSSSFPFPMPIMKLIQASERLDLSEIKDLDNVVPDLYPEGFDELKYIVLDSCDNVRCLVKTCDLGEMQTSNELGQSKTEGKFFSQVIEIKLLNLCSLEVLWDKPQQYIRFCNLVKINIQNCSSLLELFPLSVVYGLVKLREIVITDCENLVVVFSVGDEQTSGDKTAMFPLLNRIWLYRLPKLNSFYSGHATIKYPSLKYMDVEYCFSMKRWSYGENNIPKIKFKHKEKLYRNINDSIAAQLEEDGEFCVCERGSDDTKDEIIEE